MITDSKVCKLDISSLKVSGMNLDIPEHICLSIEDDIDFPACSQSALHKQKQNKPVTKAAKVPSEDLYTAGDLWGILQSNLIFLEVR